MPLPSQSKCACGHGVGVHTPACLCGCEHFEAPEALTHEEVRELAAIVRRADERHETDGGSTRHWVRDHFLPELEAANWTIKKASD